MGEPTFVSRHLDAIAPGRYSAQFRIDVDGLSDDGSTIFRIFKELEIIEGISPGPSRMKEAAPLTGQILEGLWHKHFTSSRFILQNIAAYWRGREVPSVSLSQLGSDADREALRGYVSRMIGDAYRARESENKLTGEWIVFAKQDGKNYYLTLAYHTEGDANIWLRCRNCSSEFPDLKIIQSDRSGS